MANILKSFRKHLGNRDTLAASLIIHQLADVNEYTYRDKSCLTMAVETNNMHVVEILIAKGARTDFPDIHGCTPLMTAAREGYADIVNILIDKCCINDTDDDGNTAVHWASYGGRAEIVKILVEAGADATIQDNCGYPPIMTAAEHGREDVVKLLLDEDLGINHTADTMQRALQLAVYNKHENIIKVLRQKMTTI